MDSICAFADDCTVSFEGSRDRTQRDRVIVVAKPDKTVLAHDVGGYQPVARLTRANPLTTESGPRLFGLVTRAGD